MILDIWREAGAGRGLGETTERIAARVGAVVPLAGILIRRLEAERQRIDPVAAAWLGGAPVAPARRDLSPRELEALVAWSHRVGCGSGGDAAVAPAVAGLTGADDALVAALMDGERVLGFAVAVGGPGRLGAEARDLWEQLREPFAASLRAEIQRDELLRYRAALEEDKRALLTRLDRQEITGAIVGAEGGLRGVVDRVAQVAATEVPVLLLGETGTGKEVIAREIHRQSARASGPVIKVNCGAIPPGLIDSELFGHERGSFTGAMQDRAGWFERADGGTLFLDEIGELPLDAQVRLLRVLQDGTFERVGARRTQTVDVRLVAATHRDLHGMIEEGRFREDLWYRISVFPIRLPPLRERPADIPALAEHFAWGAGRRLGGVPLAPSPGDVELLLAYPWPGNVRELAAVIERAAILGGGHRLEVGAALGISPPPPVRGASPPSGPPAAAPFATLEAATRRHIEEALERSGGRIEGPRGAAALLEVNPHTLRSRMRRLQIEWAEFRGRRPGQRES